jgi:zinc protease
MRFFQGRTVLLMLAAVLGIGALAGAAGAADGPWVDPKDMPTPALNPILTIEPEKFVLPNGMVFFLYEDHDFPLVDAQAIVRVGSMYDPKDKVGLATITGDVMRSGGTAVLAGDAMDERLESLGASVEVNIGGNQGFATMSVLSQDTDEGMHILSEVLRQPAFPEDKIDLAKKQERTAIASRNDEPLSILGREIPKLIYGKDHPFARHTEYATIEAITRTDLQAFHAEFFHPDRVIMTVYGDFETAKMKKLLGDCFGDWPKSTKPLPPEPDMNPKAVTGTFVADKTNTTNSAVVLAQVGMKMDDPDYAAMQVYHEIMGGGLSSRLFGEIRTKRGLAYATGSASGAGMAYPGGEFFYALTQTDSTAKTLQYIKHEVDRSIQEPFTPEEIQRGKDTILNSLVFALSSKGSVLNRIGQYEYYGYPHDFLQKYQTALQSLDGPQILEAAKRKVVPPAQMATIVVGEEGKFGPALKAEAGAYKEIDIAIPPAPGDEAPKASEADFVRGQEILRQAAEATGGKALQSLKDISVDAEAVVAVQGMEIKLTQSIVKLLPDCVRAVQNTPMGSATQCICGDAGWMETPRGVEDMPPEALAAARQEQTRDLTTLLRDPSKVKAQALAEPVDVEGFPADVVLIQTPIVEGWKVYVDKQSHLVVRMDYKTKSELTGGPVTAQELMGGYKAVGGIQIAHSTRILYDGEPFISVTLTSVKVNSGVDPAIFKKP